MNNTIICKNCGAKIEISEAFKHQIEEDVLLTEKKKYETKLEEVRKAAEVNASRKAREQFEFTLKEMKDSALEAKDRNSKLQEQLLDLTKQLRKVSEEKEDAKLEMEKRLTLELDKSRLETLKKLEEEHRFKDAEKDKKLNDALKANEEMRRKLEQGSQQTQGEVLELELENLLIREFPDDRISEVKKGQRGADVIQNVIDKRGRECGKIIWETKNAQWSEGWISKLREDQRQAKANLSVLVVTNPPDKIETFNYRGGVWITTYKSVVGLAIALRFDLIHIYNEKLNSVGKNEKMEVLYQYLTGTEFRHRIEAIVEAFTYLQSDIEREKRWFSTKWARQEKEIRKIIDNTQGFYGELQAVTGRELAEVKQLKIPDESET